MCSSSPKRRHCMHFLLLLLLLLHLLLQCCRSHSLERPACGWLLSPAAAARSVLTVGSATTAFAKERGMPRETCQSIRVRAS